MLFRHAAPLVFLCGSSMPNVMPITADDADVLCL
jgi:hypothetical protein